MTRSFSLVVRRMGELLLMAMLGLLAILAISIGLQLYRTHVEPLDTWFRPLHLNVPDFCSGDNPKITYDCQVLHAFEGSYHTQYVSVRVNAAQGFPICEYNSGTFGYSPREDIRVTPRLHDFMGRSCVLLKGRYRVEVTWHPQRPGYLDETITLHSNIFTVHARTEPQCERVHDE